MGSYEDIGPYAIERVLGRGGMGVVYAGTRLDTGVRAAIKTVSATKADRIFQIRREIETLARLRHPGVVRILDHGVADGRPWYAMDLLDGLTLQQVAMQFWSVTPHVADDAAAGLAHAELAETASSTTLLAAARGATADGAPNLHVVVRRSRAANGHLPETLGLIQRLCETLAYVHGEGVVHRDLKPSNIFVTSDGLPVLVDFGLVAHVGVATGREVLDETRIAGSVKYMAPEQIAGELLDPRADMYALGCVVYELLTGGPPFEGNITQVMEQHQNARPCTLNQLVSGVAEELAQTVMRMLAKEPRDRLAYARDVAAVIGRSGYHAPAWRGEVPRVRSYLCRSAFVGRHDVLREIDSTVRGLESRRGGLVLVSGESGVGKTRLALEVAWRASVRGGNVVTGGCVPVLSDASTGTSLQGAPLHPLRPLLQAIADRCTEIGLAESERVVGDRGPVLAAYEPTFLGVPGQAGRPAAPPLPLAAARERLFRSLVDTIAAHASAAPTLLLLDDLQWADELTLGFLEYLARGPIGTMPVLVLGTYRIEESNPALSALSGNGAVLTISLSKLSFANVGDMVGGMLAMHQPPRGFVSFLFAKSEGNPFFLAEYLRMAVAEQVILRTPAGEWTFAATTDPTEVVCESLPLPRSLRDVIERRLAVLSAAARQAVNCATLLGREFDAATLRAALLVSEAEMSAILGELADRHIIEAMETADTFRFAHDKLREIPHAALSADERRGLHRRIALAIERRADGDRLDASLGHHWSGAGEPARAIPHLCNAGDRAQALHALGDAAQLYRAALQDLARLRTSEPSAMLAEEAGLRERLADTLALLGAHEDARVEFDWAIAALGANRAVDGARLHRKIGKALETLHDHATALEAYAHAEQLLESTAARDDGWRAEWIQVYLNRLWVYYWQARIDDMDAQLALVAPVVEAHGLPLQRSSYYQAIVTRDYRKHRYVISDQTLHHARQSLAFAVEADARVEAAFARFVLGFGLLFHGSLEDAEAELYEALQETRRLGDVTSQARCLAYLVIVSRRAGRADDCAKLAQEALPLASALKMHDYAGVAHAGLGWAAWRNSGDDEARRHCQAALDAWAQPSYAYPFQWTGALTMIAVQASQAPVRQLVALAETLLDPQQMRLPVAIEEALESAVAAYRGEDAEGAREALQRAVSVAGGLGFI
jgi:eukaryotic-like serine/threonine-protein kinase